MTADGFTGPVTDDFDFTLGHVTGVRGFKLDQYDRLVGVTKRKVFKPGVNIATCGTEPTDDIADHCCGYYAYFQEEGTNDPNFYNAEVGAIVRGYGRTVVGTKGFRAEKADLVALFPLEKEKPKPATKAPKTPRPQPNFFSRFYPREGWFRTHGAGFGWVFGSTLASVLLLFSLSFTIPFSLLEHSGVTTVIAACTPPAFMWAVGFSRRTCWAAMLPTWRKPDSDDPDLRKLQYHTRPDKPQEITQARLVSVSIDLSDDIQKDSPLTKLQKLYPDVPVYSSLEEAVAAHPLTTVEEATPPPPTPENTDGFWDLPPNDEEDGIYFNNGGLITRGSLSFHNNTWYIP